MIKNIHSKLNKQFKSLVSKPISSHVRVISSMLAFIFIGTLVITFSRAATSSASIEAENLNSTLAGCANRTYNVTNASGNGAIRFGCSGGPLTLDKSGKTITQTEYPIPSAAIYMSPLGSDANDGKSVGAPVKSINTAVTKSANGGTIVMRGGEYRDWYNTAGNFAFINKGLTIQAYPKESPWFNGSDIVSGWTSENNGVWSRSWETPSFCNGKYYDYATPPYTPQRNAAGTIDPNIAETACMYRDAANDPSYPMAGNPQQVFVNDIRKQEVASLAQVNNDTFYYDWYARKMYIGSNPTGAKVELSARPVALILSGAETDEHKILGIGFKRYATNTGDIGVQTTAAVYVARKVTLENSVFMENAANAISFSKPRLGSVVRRVVVAHNGVTGIAANGSSTKRDAGRNDLLVEDSIFNSNNIERSGLNCNYACGPAGIKMVHMVGYTVRNSIFENTQGPRGVGFWCDADCSDGKMYNNIFRDNGYHGLYYEVSNNGIIASNLFVNNAGVSIALPSANTKIYNNTIVTKSGPSVESIWIYDDNRTAQYSTDVWPYYKSAPYDVGPDTQNVQIANNLFVSPTDKTSARLVNSIVPCCTDEAKLRNTSPNQYISELNYNAFYHLANQSLYGYIDSSGVTKDNIKNSTDLRNSHPSAANFELNSFAVTVTAADADSPFVNRSAGNYQLKTSSRAYTEKGKPIPPEVARLIGVPDNAVLPRGAVNWPR